MRRVVRFLPVLAIVGLVAACVPTKPPAPDPCEGPDVTVTADNLCGWTENQGGTGVGDFITGPATPPAGTGSYGVASGDDDDAGGFASISSPPFLVPLADITTLDYSTLIVDHAGGGTGGEVNNRPWLTSYLTLSIDTDGNVTTTTDQAEIVFEPCYSHASNCASEIQPLNTWSEWQSIGTDKKWWLDNDTALCGGPPPVPGGAEFVNLTELILDTCPNSVVFQITLSAGQGGGGAPWLDFAGAFDQLVLAIDGGPESTFDFED
jgi:hypothetical protein